MINVAQQHEQAGCQPDHAITEEFIRIARELSEDEISELRAVPLPKTRDYSKYVTFIRHQGTSTSCTVQSSATILSILKKMERPYSPDFSSGFLGYVYNVSIGYYPPDARIAKQAINQIEVAKQYGCCSEASLPSHTTEPPNSQVPAPWQIPTPMAWEEAKSYRIQSFKVVRSPSSIEDIKSLLYNKGPLVRLFGGHCMALIGYDDINGVFKFVDSYGDQVHSQGFLAIPYSQMSQELPETWVTWAENSPTPPSVGVYTGRIRLHHNLGRRYCTVLVGVEGHQPIAAWNGPGPAYTGDTSLNLTFDFLLPNYANQHWPPNETNRWYVDIIDHSPPSSASTEGEVEEVTLVERVMQGSRCIPILHRPSARGFPIPHRGTVRIYVPSRKRYMLTLDVDHSQITSGSQVEFHGMLFLQVGLSNTWNPRIPLANQTVNIFKTIYDPIEGNILEELIGTATTDSNGRYLLRYSPTETSNYQALVTKPDHTVMATSNFAEVKVV